MATWFFAHNYTAADPSSLQAVVPVDETYAELVTGDMCIVYYNGETSIFRYDSTSSTTQNVPTIVTPDGNAGNGRWIRKDFSTWDKNGFDAFLADPDELDNYCTLGVSGTTFTLTHVLDYNVYVQGVQYTKTGNETVEITDVDGVHWIYFDNTGTIQIQAPGGTTDELILQNCLIAAVYWDATGNQAIMLMDERHGSNMAPITHYHFHEVFGAKWESGMSLSNFDTDGNGQSASHAQFDFNSGEFHDEDLEITIPTDTDATIDTFYRLGAGGPWRKASATANYPVADPITGTRMDWNDYNGGTWQLQEVTNNSYVLTHYFATNDVLGGGVIGIMGQASYTTLPQARAGADTELSSLLSGDLPLTEILPIATVIWKTADTMTNQVMGAIYSVTGGGDYVDWRTTEISGAGVSISDHESLSGLLGGAAADHYHLTGAQETDLTDGGDTVLHNHAELDYSGVKAFETSAGGIRVFDTSGSDPAIILEDDASADLARIQGTGAATTGIIRLQVNASSGWENILTGTYDGAVELYYDNVKALETTADGINVLDTSGNDAKLVLQSSTPGDLATIHASASALTITGHVHAGTLELRQEDTGGTADLILDGTGDGSVNLYYGGVKILSTEQWGIDVRDWSGSAPYMRLLTDAGALVTRFYNDGTDTYIDNNIDSGLVYITGEDSGSADTTMASFDPDGAVELYYDGLLSLQTEADGIRVYDASGDDTAIKFYKSTGPTLMHKIVVENETTFKITPVGPVSSVFQVNVADSGGNADTAIKATGEGSVDLYHNNVRTLSTNTSGIEILDRVGTNPSIYMYDDDGTTRRIRMYGVGTTDFYIENNVHGGDIWLSAEDSGGTKYWAGLNQTSPAWSPSPDSAVNLGTSTVCWLNVYADAGVTSCSDEKYKKDVQVTELGLSFINDLVPVAFKFNRTGKRPKNHVRTYQGLLANEVEAALQQHGHTYADFAGIEESFDDDGERWLGLKYEQFIAPLIKSVQELSTEVDQLKAEKILMQTQLQDVMVRLSALENPTESHSTPQT